MPCAHCNQTGHNKRTCPFISKEMVAEQVEVVNMEEEVSEKKGLVLELEDGVNEEVFYSSEEDEEEEEEEEEEKEEEEIEFDIELVRLEAEMYMKHGFNEEGKLEKKRGRPKGSKNKVVEVVKVEKKRGRPKGSKNKVAKVEKKRGRPKGSKNKVQKARKRKTMDIDTSGLKITRSIAEIIASTGRMIDGEYIMD